jgi:hypothetical protein
MHLTLNNSVKSLLKMLIRQNVRRTALLRRLLLAEHLKLKR